MVEHQKLVKQAVELRSPEKKLVASNSLHAQPRKRVGVKSGKNTSSKKAIVKIGVSRIEDSL
jgi:hypothetical protein